MRTSQETANNTEHVVENNIMRQDINYKSKKKTIIIKLLKYRHGQSRIPKLLRRDKKLFHCSQF